MHPYAMGCCASTPHVGEGPVGAEQVTVSVIRAQVNDREALVRFFKATGGAKWKNKRNWCTQKPVETWFGVTVDSDGQVRLDLRNNNLIGANHRRSHEGSTCDVCTSYSFLAGALPKELEDPVNLIYIDVSDNALTGPLSTAVLSAPSPRLKLVLCFCRDFA